MEHKALNPSTHCLPLLALYTPPNPPFPSLSLPLFSPFLLPLPSLPLSPSPSLSLPLPPSPSLPSLPLPSPLLPLPLPFSASLLLLQLYFSKVHRLFTWSKELETVGNMHMQVIQTLAVDVSAKWSKGVDVATKRKSALQDTLTFHINLFEVCTYVFMSILWLV